MIFIRQQHLIITVLLAVPALKYVAAFPTTFLCINYFALLFPYLFPLQSLLCCFPCLSPFAPLLFCCCLFFFHSNVCSSAVSLFLSIRTFALPFPCLLPFHSGLRLAGFLFFPIQTSLWCFLVYFHLSLSLLFSCLFQFQPLHCCFLVCFHSHLAPVFSCLFPFQSCCYFHFSFGSFCGFMC